MKILHTVEFYSPGVGGAQEVVKQISEHLVKSGHSVTVATTRLPERTSHTINGVQIEGFAISGNEVRGFKGDIGRYQQFLLDSDFDIMMNYAAQQWATDLVFPLLDRIRYRKVLAPCGFSGLLDPKYAEYFKELPEVMNRYDHLIFHSDMYRDIEFARKQRMSHYTVIPNGAAMDEFDQIDSSFRERYRIPQEATLLLTVGSHTGMKGHRLAIEAFRSARIGRSVLVIIGNTIGGRGCLPECRRLAWWVNLASLRRKCVLLLNPSRPDVVAAYHAADLFVFGSNIECSPLVIFEAMASKTPFITIACGNAGEIVNWSQGGLLLPTIQRRGGLVDAEPKFVARVIEDLLRNHDQMSRLGEAGYNAWQKRFTWEKLACEYERLYQSVLDNKER